MYHLIILIVNILVLRQGNCQLNDSGLHLYEPVFTVHHVVGGELAELNEFPHAALLGYGDMPNIEWECGGSLINERWVLTAGHCILTRLNGNVKYIRLGGPKVDDKIDPDYLYSVARIIAHPEYVGSSKYNDIALLQTDRIVRINDQVKPGCLRTENPLDDEKPFAIGWGSTRSGGERSSALQKVQLEMFTFEECSRKNPKSRRLLMNGINNETQLCAGHKTESKDTCQGDSGGPLLLNVDGVNCSFLIIGITSFGRSCGVVGQPAVYTRVSAFVPWIESIVRP